VTRRHGATHDDLRGLATSGLDALLEHVTRRRQSGERFEDALRAAADDVCERVVGVRPLELYTRPLQARPGAETFRARREARRRSQRPPEPDPGGKVDLDRIERLRRELDGS
jgi:hypothetical protein